MRSYVGVLTGIYTVLKKKYSVVIFDENYKNKSVEYTSGKTQNQCQYIDKTNINNTILCI